MNSWCKVVNGQIIDGPRAWADNSPPDETWFPHRLEDTPHTINDNFIGSHHEVRGNEVVEVKDYAPKSQDQIDDEIRSIKNLAVVHVAKADEMLANPALSNRDEWQAFRDAWAALTNITALSWDYYMPAYPKDANGMEE